MFLKDMFCEGTTVQDVLFFSQQRATEDVVVETSSNQTKRS